MATMTDGRTKSSLADVSYRLVFALVTLYSKSTVANSKAISAASASNQVPARQLRELLLLMPTGLEDDEITGTRAVERAATRLALGANAVNGMYSMTELREAILAGITGQQLQEDIRITYGVSEVTLRKKMAQLSEASGLSRKDLREICSTDAGKAVVKSKIDSMELKDRGGQYYLQPNEVRLYAAIAHNATEAGMPKTRKRIRLEQRTLVRTIGEQISLEGAECNDAKMIKRGEKMSAAKIPIVPLETHQEHMDGDSSDEERDPTSSDED
jgi:hypothetical protein